MYLYVFCSKGVYKLDVICKSLSISVSNRFLQAVLIKKTKGGTDWKVAYVSLFWCIFQLSTSRMIVKAASDRSCVEYWRLLRSAACEGSLRVQKVHWRRQTSAVSAYCGVPGILEYMDAGVELGRFKSPKRVQGSRLLAVQPE